jgi:hypothetical protein
VCQLALPRFVGTEKAVAAKWGFRKVPFLRLVADQDEAASLNTCTNPAENVSS